jgi:hypothetical protein
MNPSKQAQFSKNNLIPSAADKYLCQIICDEMPQGLKKYMEYELFLQIHLKVRRGILLRLGFNKGLGSNVQVFKVENREYGHNLKLMGSVLS